jgi:hypothetical protein
MKRSKRRLRSSVNDEEFCIIRGYVCDARILLCRSCSRSGARHRLHHCSSEGEYESRQDYPRRAAVIKLYTQKYPNLTDAEAKAMAEQMLDCESRLAGLKKKYYKKFNKVLPALTVTKFFQLDRRIDLLMDMNVEVSLPPLTQAQYTVPGSSAAEPPQQ